MEGGGGVHSKFMHILVQELLVQGNILSRTLYFFASFRFLEE